MMAHLVSLLRGEDPIEVEAYFVDQDGDDSVTSDLYPDLEALSGKTGGSTVVPSTERRVTAAYAFGALGLVLTIAVALALPTFIPAGCPSGLDCSRHLNMAKVVLILPGLLVALMGLIAGAFQAYRAQS